MACNLASPVISGTLFETLVGHQAGNAKTYGQLFVLMASLYITEPLLTRVYIQNICALSEKVSTLSRTKRFYVSGCSVLKFGLYQEDPNLQRCSSVWQDTGSMTTVL